MDFSQSPEELEGRLAAQRHVLAWILSRLVQSPDDLDALTAAVDETFPPPDHQEDPGAVPTRSFAAFAAGALELRLLLDPLKARWRADSEAPNS